MALDPIIARHKLLLTTIKDEFETDSNEYASFIEHFKGYVPRGQLAAKKDLLGKFDALASRGHLRPGKYDVLKKISEDSGNNNITKLIEEAEEDISVLRKSSDNNGQQGSSTAPPRSRPTVQDVTNDGPSSKRARTELDNPDPLYRRRGNHGYWDNTGKKGLLLILNFTENRAGTDLDVDRLKDFFGPARLNFEILDPRQGEQHDLTKSQVEAALESVQNKLNDKYHKPYYCFVCVILSHGDEVGIKTRGDGRKSIDEIQKSFNNKNIPNFAGRPKLFFIQACRGHRDQTGQYVDDSDDAQEDENNANNGKDEADDLIHIPTDADTLTAFATTLGHRSFRRSGIGSWFITECMNVFTRDHIQDHVEEMLITVRENVALNWVKDDGKTKQMPCVTSTLTKRLMFTKSE